jgi:type VI secretion system protein ImpA
LPITWLSELAETQPAAEPDAADGAPEPDAADGAAEPAPRQLEARTRDDAIRLLEQIGTYYRVAEPSSPVPFLTERARSFAQRDFLSLLKEVLPEGAFKGSD